MKTIKIHKDSWHYRIVKVYTSTNPQYIDNLCEYNRRVLLGIIHIGFLIFLATIIAIPMLSPVFYGVLYLIYGFSDIGEDQVTVVVMGGVIWGFSISFYIGDVLWNSVFFNPKQWAQQQDYEVKLEQQYKKDSYVGATWKSFKEKVCLRIEVE